MSKRKRNHYLTKAIARNFFSNSKSGGVWEFNPSCTPNIRVKSPEKLFSKLNAWNKGLENIVGSVENEIVPLLKQLSTTPHRQRTINGLYCGIESLDSLVTSAEIEIIEHYYIVQLILLRIARTGRDEGDEAFAEKAVQLIADKKECIFFPHAWRICLNPEEAMETPLVLTDNLLTLWAIFEKYESDARRINSYAPLTENTFLFWGDSDDLALFMQRHPSIDRINRERIRESGRLCRFASTNKIYLEELAKSWRYIHEGPSTGLRIELLPHD